MLSARHTRRIQIINGLKPKLLGRALVGEAVGTVISVDPVAVGRSRRATRADSSNSRARRHRPIRPERRTSHAS
jgi:hypothetical protein